MAEIRSVSNVLAPRQADNAPVATVPPGASILECFQSLELDPAFRPMVRAFYQGDIVEDWDTKTQEGETVIFALLPAGGGDSGGKSTFALVAMVAIAVFAQWAGPALAANLAGGAATGAVGAPATVLGMSYVTAGKVFTAGIGILGSLAVAAMYKPPVVGLNSPVVGNMPDPAAPNPLITGQSNQARAGQVIPVIFGEHPVYPDLAALPYVEKKGCHQVLHAVYCLGVGNVTAFAHTLALGGVPWDTLKDANPGMEYRVWTAGPVKVGGVWKTAAVKTDWYVGRRNVHTDNKEIAPYDPATYPVYTEATVPPADQGNKMYLDVIFPGGIYDINTNRGTIKEHTTKLLVEVKDGNTWRDLKVSDFYDPTDLSQFVCQEAGEEILTSEIIKTPYTEVTWGYLDAILDRGDDAGREDIKQVCVSRDQICGGNSDKDGKVAGWNSGIQGRSLPHRCTDAGDGDNKKNAITYPERIYYEDPFGVPGTKLVKQFARAKDNSTAGSNVYYIFKHDAFAVTDGGSSFVESAVTFTFAVSDPIDYDTGKKVDDLVCQVFVLGWDAAGNNKVHDFTHGSLTTIKKDGTTYLGGSIYIPPNSPAKIIQIGLAFDVQKTAPRRGGIRVIDTDIKFRPVTVSPGVQDDARVRVLYPVKDGSGNGYESAPPLRGNLLYFATHSKTGCPDGDTLCRPASDGGSLRPKGAIPHEITGIIQGGQVIKDGQTFQEYTLTVDNVITETDIDAVFTEHLVEPGFAITAKSRAPIHFGLELKKFNGVRFYRKEAVSAHAVEKAILASTSIIQTGANIAFVPASHSLKYTFLEIKVPASETLGTTLKPLSLRVGREMRSFAAGDYDIDTPHNDQATTAVGTLDGNPAWAYINVLMGSPASKPIRLGAGEYLTQFIDLEAFRRWADMCTAEKFRFDYIVTGYSTIGEMLQMIAATGRGKPTMIDGRHSIIFDGDPAYFTGSGASAKAIIRQVITPENSWNGSSKLSYLGDVHGLRVLYQDTETAQQGVVEILMPNFEKEPSNADSDYYNPAHDGPWIAQKWETLNLPGVGNFAQADKLGEYFIKEVRLRRERAVRTMDVENLISREGDIVSLADDVMRLGGKPAYITKTSGATGTVTVNLDKAVPKMTNFGVRFRYYHGAEKKPRVSDPIAATVDPNGSGDLTEIRFAVPSGAKVKVGYLLLWGRVDRISKEYQVEHIKYSPDLTATLELLEYYPDPLNYDGGRDPVGESPVLGEVDAPLNVKLEVVWIPTPDGFIGRFTASWDAVRGISENGGYYRVVFSSAIRGVITRDTQYTTRGFERECGAGGSTQGVRVYAVDKWGNESKPGSATIGVEVPEEFIPEVENFSINLGRNAAELTWSRVEAETLTEYEVRYSQSVVPGGAIWEGARQLWVGTGEYYLAENHRKGTFFIKARGTCGTESANPAIIISDVADDVDTTTKDQWTVYDITVDGMLTTANPAGNKADLMRGTAKIGETWLKQTENDMPSRIDFATGAVTDTKPGPVIVPMYKPGDDGANNCFEQYSAIYFNPNFGTAKIPRNAECYLDAVARYDPGRDVHVYVRDVNNCTGAMGASQAGQVPIYRTWDGATVPPIEEGWKDIEGGEISVGEHVQLGIRYWQSRPNLALWTGKLEVMVKYASRNESGDDVDCPEAGKTVTFNHGFFELPSISILGQDLRPGDYWRITNKTTSGFFIRFFNSTGTAKAVTFDWIASGYGVK